MEKTVCIRPDICGGYIRFHKTALFHKKRRMAVTMFSTCSTAEPRV